MLEIQNEMYLFFKYNNEERLQNYSNVRAQIVRINTVSSSNPESSPLSIKIC